LHISSLYSCILHLELSSFPTRRSSDLLLQFLLTGKHGHAKEILLNDKKQKPGSFTDLFAYASQSPVIFADTLWFNLTLGANISRSEEHTSELQSRFELVCRLLLEKKDV